MRPMLRWFEKEGSNSDVVISSRVRLARNLADYNFSLKLSGEDAGRMTDEVMDKISVIPDLKEYSSFNFKDMNDYQKVAMTERHVISPYLLSQKIAAGMVSPEEDVSIMLNEEDHIRIQSFVEGSDILSAYKKADSIDDILSGVVEYAYDSQYGYLTTCPSNVGTGLRASYMLHLPALTGTSKLNSLASEVGRFGLNIRGIYSDGTKVIGDIYQISNQVTLGFSEMDIIDNLSNIVYQIVEQERAARKQYINKRFMTAQDAVYRSYGVLKYARKLSFKDAMVLLSELRMGISQGLLELAEKKPFSTYNMIIGIQPANLHLIAGRDLLEEELDIERAGFIRQNLPKIQ